MSNAAWIRPKLDVVLNVEHYNKLLYLCSVQIGNGDVDDNVGVSHLGLQRGFEIFQQMLNYQVEPNEATFTNPASVEVKNEDKVYEMLHRLRAVVRQVSESTLKIIEDWFNLEFKNFSLQTLIILGK